MTNKDVFTLEGVVLRKFPTEFGEKAGKKWAKNKFVLKTKEGRDLYISKFGAFDTKLLGQDVKFQATKFNDTNYTVQGEIGAGKVDTTAPVEAQAEQPVTEQTVTPRRGRPAKAKAVEEQQAEPVVSTSMDEALEIVARNIHDAIKLKDTAKLDVVNIIELADMIGRTRVALRIEANKDRRMDSFKR